MKLTELKPDENNANKGTQRGRRELENSLREHGWVEAGVLDKHNRIVGGNKRQEVAVDIGLPDEAIIVDHDGSKPIFVRLTDVDLDTPEGRLLAYRLNRVAQLDIDFDAEQITLDLGDGLDLSGLWEDWELAIIQGEGVDDPLAEWEGMPEFENPAAAARSIIVHFETEADVSDFSILIEQNIGEKTKSLWYPEKEKRNLRDIAYVAKP